MLAHVHCSERGNRMVVIRSADGDDVDLVAKLVEHFTKVAKLLCLRKLKALSFPASDHPHHTGPTILTPFSAMWLVSLPPLPPTPMHAAVSEFNALNLLAKKRAFECVPSQTPALSAADCPMKSSTCLICPSCVYLSTLLA